MADTKPLTTNTLMSDVSLLRRKSQITSDNYFLFTVIEGHDFGCTFQFDKLQFVIGRKDENNDADFQIEDERASRRHLLLLKQPILDQENGVRIVVLDLGSMNGTLINGKRISENSEIEISSGDKIQIGDTVLKFEVKTSLDINYHERLYHQVTRDALTGLWNHNYLQHELTKLLSFSTRNELPLSLLMIEIDFFQTIIESYGENVSSTVLRNVAQLILAQLNESCVMARFNDKQFIVLLPETDLKGAASIAERLRHKVESFDFAPLGCAQRITVCIGITQYPVCGRGKEELIKQADETLYSAKQAGRNCIQTAEVKKKEVSAPKRKKYLKVALQVLGVVLLIATGFWIYPKIFSPKQLIFSGLIESREIQTGSQAGGYVTEVLVEEGQLVKTGQLLVRFDIKPLIAQKAIYQARIDQAEAQLQKLLNGNRPEEIEQAEAEARRTLSVVEALRNGARPQEIAQAKTDLAAAEIALTYAQNSYQRAREIFEKGLSSRQTLDDTEVNVKSAQAKVDTAREKLSLLTAGNRAEDIRGAEEMHRQALTKVKMLKVGSRQEDIAEARARITEAKAQLEQLNIQIQDADVVAPSDSLVEVISVRPGNLIGPGKTVVKLLEQDQLWVRIYVPEPDLGFIKLNQKAAITVDTFPNRSFAGYIEQISSQGEFTPRNVQTRKERDYQVFGVKVHIENNNGELKSGMAADVNLSIGK